MNAEQWENGILHRAIEEILNKSLHALAVFFPVMLCHNKPQTKSCPQRGNSLAASFFHYALILLHTRNKLSSDSLSTRK